MLSIQLVVSDHTYTIPQPSVLGDKELGSERSNGAGASDRRVGGGYGARRD